MQTLYEENPAAWERLKANGFPKIAEAAKLFYLRADMDRALGYQNNVAKWMRQDGLPTRVAETAAAAILAQHRAKQETMTIPEPKPAEKQLLLLACDAATAEKVKKIAAMLGAEIVEV